MTGPNLGIVLLAIFISDAPVVGRLGKVMYLCINEPINVEEVDDVGAKQRYVCVILVRLRG